MSASFLRQKIYSPLQFPSLFLSSLESFSAKLGAHVTLWFALTPPSLKWLTEQKNPKYLLSLQNAQRDTTNFAVIVTVSVVLQQVLAAETCYLQFIWQIHIQRTQSHFFTLFKLHQRLISPAWINNRLCILTLSEPRPVAKWRPWIHINNRFYGSFTTLFSNCTGSNHDRLQHLKNYWFFFYFFMRPQPSSRQSLLVSINSRWKSRYQNKTTCRYSFLVVSRIC